MPVKVFLCVGTTSFFLNNNYQSNNCVLSENEYINFVEPVVYNFFF